MTSEESLSRLIEMITQINLMALDKALAAIYSATRSNTLAAECAGRISKKLTFAAKEISLTLPLEQRACSRLRK